MNCLRKKLFALSVFIIIAGFSHVNAQKQQTLQEANYVHDKMYNLIHASSTVEIPSDIINQLEQLNKDQPDKDKITKGQITLLKVMFNEALPKNDLRFFGEQILKNNSAMYSAIHTLVRKQLKKL